MDWFGCTHELLYTGPFFSFVLVFVLLLGIWFIIYEIVVGWTLWSQWCRKGHSYIVFSLCFFFLVFKQLLRPNDVMFCTYFFLSIIIVLCCRSFFFSSNNAQCLLVAVVFIWFVFFMVTLYRVQFTFWLRSHASKNIYSPMASGPLDFDFVYHIAFCIGII